MSDEHETALLLTDTEWNDLAHMVSHYVSCNTWTESETLRLNAGDAHVDDLNRRHALAARIIEAT